MDCTLTNKMSGKFRRQLDEILEKAERQEQPKEEYKLTPLDFIITVIVLLMVTGLFVYLISPFFVLW